MKYQSIKSTCLAGLIIGSLALAELGLAAPPTPVAEMTPKEVKTYKRDANSVSFDTKTFKDSANAITWLESPVMSDSSTPNLRHYFRSAFKDGKLVVIQIIVTQVHIGFTEFDPKTNDFNAARIGTTQLPTEAGDALRDPASNSITQRSSIQISEAQLRAHELTGIHLLVKNTYGETEVPIRAATVTGYLKRFDKMKAK